MAFDAAREEVMFQSTPAPIGAGDKDYASALAMLQSFNPHPLRSERVTSSITKPHRPMWFQSTPAPIGAGDKPEAWYMGRTDCFNPHPLRSERVTWVFASSPSWGMVSIHTRSDRSG